MRPRLLDGTRIYHIAGREAVFFFFVFSRKDSVLINEKCVFIVLLLKYFENFVTELVAATTVFSYYFIRDIGRNRRDERRDTLEFVTIFG